MRVLRAAAVVALLTGPAYAQVPQVNLMPDLPSKTQEEKDADAVRDKAYKESLRKIPDAKVSTDPWGNVRSDPPKAAAVAPKTPARPKTKTACVDGVHCYGLPLVSTGGGREEMAISPLRHFALPMPWRACGSPLGMSPKLACFPNWDASQNVDRPPGGTRIGRLPTLY
jgi:hypothetical protein